jgi:hypothetical protein
VFVSDIRGIAEKDFFPRQRRDEMLEKERNNKKEDSSLSVFSTV